MSENTTAMSQGLLKWTIDSVFRLISPSPNYESINNYNNNNLVNDSMTSSNRMDNETIVRNRSSSHNCWDSSLYKKYELLYNKDTFTSTTTNNNKNNKNIVLFPVVASNGWLISPIKLIYGNFLPKDTFLNKKIYSLPIIHTSNSNNKVENALLLSLSLNKRFNKEVQNFDKLKLNKNVTKNIFIINSSMLIKGKFPKNIQSSNDKHLITHLIDKDSEPEIDCLFVKKNISNELEINKKKILQINQYVRCLLEENSKFKTDFNQVKLELVYEWQQYNMIVERYLLLNDKYNELQIRSNKIFKINSVLSNINKDQMVQIEGKQQRIDQIKSQIYKKRIDLDGKLMHIYDLKNEVKLLKDQLNRKKKKEQKQKNKDSRNVI